MKRLFVNEWIKMRYSKQLRILLAGILILVLVMGITMQGLPGYGFWYVGVTSSFEYMRLCATMVMMFLAPVAGTFFTQELQQGTLHNTLSCGVSRSRYFAVKAICITVSGLVIYLVSMLLYTGLRTLRAGFAPGTELYPDCSFYIAIVFQLGCCIQVLTYLTCFLLISVLANRMAIMNLAGIVLWISEAVLSISFPVWRGPVGVLLASHDLWAEGRVLTPEFLQQYIQCVIMSIIFLALSYLVFIKRDIT